MTVASDPDIPDAPDAADRPDPVASTGASGAPPADAPPSSLQEALDGDAVALGAYAERAYLEYALSVVKGRALPDVCDGQKPVQRRILYAMQRMGLAYTGASGAKPVKSARVVGDVLGRFHPHGDQAAYDALVRMAQDFSQRYPLIDGQGNFGSRDGDGAAAMRYTEARLSRHARLLLDELDDGAVDFEPNYDGSTEEPRRLPGRLPMVLLNGASGIAVGLATEIPSHNLREVAAATVALVKNEKLSDDALYALLPGPDFPGGGQIISSADEIRAAYRTGRGTLKARARWTIEDLARGQWQLVVHELPPGVSAQRVLEELEEITNPKVKAGKKALTAEQMQTRAAMLALLDTVRDEAGKEAAVRLVFEPKSRSIDQGEFARMLLAQTSLETTVAVNLTSVGLDGRPVQKSLRRMLTEWIAFRQESVRRRTQRRLEQVLDRIHILEGRQLVLLNIDEVIRIIRESDEPKPALMAAFALSERQADDILDIRLRQLARLEAIRIEQELAELRTEQGTLEDILGNPKSLERTLVREIEADAKAYGDDRRTLIEADARASVELKVVDEPVTVVVSMKGWVRALKGHEVDAATLSFKTGDALYGAFACRTVDTLAVLGSDGRAYSVAVSQLPGGRGDGQPVTALVELASGTQAVHYLAGSGGQAYAFAGTNGYGFVARLDDLVARQRGGKSFLALDVEARPLLPAPLPGPLGTDGAIDPAWRIGCLTASGRLLVFGLYELNVQPKGGRGLALIELDGPKDALVSLACVAALADGYTLDGTALRGGASRTLVLKGAVLTGHEGRRARKGRKVEGIKAQRIRGGQER